MTYSLRAATTEDWPFIEALYGMPHVTPWAPAPKRASFLRNIDEHGVINQIIERDGLAFGNMLMDFGPEWLLQLRLIAVMEPRKGAGRFALQNAIEFGFTTLNVHRIFLEIAESNAPSRRLCESLGFRAEGVYRDGYFSEHTGFQNLIPYGLLASDSHTAPSRPYWRQ